MPKDNMSIIAEGWLKIIGLDKDLPVRGIITHILDKAEEDAHDMLCAIVNECPDVVEQFRPKILSRWLFKNENKPIEIIDPISNLPILVRFSAVRKHGTEVTWRIATMPPVFRRFTRSSLANEDALPTVAA